jgi:signal transduction histidine kinase
MSTTQERPYAAPGGLTARAALVRRLITLDRWFARSLGVPSEIRQDDVDAFDHWLARENGYGMMLVIAAATGLTLLLMFVGLSSITRSIGGRWFESFGQQIFWLGSSLAAFMVISTPWTVGDLWLSHRKYAGGFRRFIQRVRQARGLRDRKAILIQLGSGGAFGAVVGFLVARSASGQPAGRGDFLLEASSLFAALLVVYGMLLLMTYALIDATVAIRDRIMAAEYARQQAELQSSEVRRKLLESRILMLQAQIEPHFLFNTLGAVQQLAATDPPRAERLTADLIAFLRATLGQIRREQASVGSELAVVRHYLAVMRQRLGARLDVDLAGDDGALDLAVPPAMLLTLVENAVKHGIEPSRSGGRIAVRCRRTDADLVLEVADTGVGMSETPGNGVGLSNVRERLLLSFGDAAALELEENEPSGVIARIRLPLAGRTITA